MRLPNSILERSWREDLNLMKKSGFFVFCIVNYLAAFIAYSCLVLAGLACWWTFKGEIVDIPIGDGLLGGRFVAALAVYVAIRVLALAIYIRLQPLYLKFYPLGDSND